MMCILALDTTLGGFGLALHSPQGTTVGVNDPTPRSSSALHPALDNLLKEHRIVPQDIDMLAVTVGPGSFTGCRIGMAFAAAWGLAQPQVQVVGLPTLACVARQVAQQVAQSAASFQQGFRVLLDAAGGSVYGQDFNTLGVATGVPFCVPLEQATATPLPLVAVGLPLLEKATWRVNALHPEILLAAAADATCHVPLEIVYLKALTYREKTYFAPTA